MPNRDKYKEQLNEITEDNRKKGLVSAIFNKGNTYSSKSPVYTIGDKMATSLKLDAKTVQKHYNGGFPFPKGDLFGICNNYKSASFFIDDKSQCTQMADLQEECSTVLNAEYYSSKL